MLTKTVELTLNELVVLASAMSVATAVAERDLDGAVMASIEFKKDLEDLGQEGHEVLLEKFDPTVR